MSVFFTSDLHFGHRFVAKIRGFDSVEEHDAVLCDRWRDLVGPDDVVWVLGDIAVSRSDVALDLLRALPGRKRLVAGNHDKVHPMYRDAPKHAPAYLSAFEWVTLHARTRLMGQSVLLSHLPYERDRETPPRHTQWRLPNEGTPLLHGHLHQQVRVSAESGAVEIHVGLDAWDLAPVKDEALAALIPK